jgi:hypothetical protein
MAVEAGMQQQSAATAATSNDPQHLVQSNELHKRPSPTYLPLNGKEKVYGSIP